MKSTWRIGVTTLNARVQRSHRLPNRYIVRIVSAVVPLSVVIMDT
jgi:hypothetical protein